MNNRREYITDWEGIVISITHANKYCGVIEHLEIRSIDPPKALLPITETGYRSHFISEGTLDTYDSPLAYVLAWLEYEADKPEWKAQELAARQYTLF